MGKSRRRRSSPFARPSPLAAEQVETSRRAPARGSNSNVAGAKGAVSLSVGPIRVEGLTFGPFILHTALILARLVFWGLNVPREA